MRKRAVCLMSGGLDSSVAAALLVRSGWDLVGLNLDYGQAAAARERAAFASVCSHLGMRGLERDLLLWREARSLIFGGPGPSFVLHRNLALLVAADIAAQELDAGAVACGICSSPEYPDTSGAFCSVAQSLLQMSARSDRLVLAPVIHLSKPQIGVLARELGLPLEKTVSCHRPGDGACGACDGCSGRRAALGGGQ